MLAAHGVGAELLQQRDLRDKVMRGGSMGVLGGVLIGCIGRCVNRQAVLIGRVNSLC